jgi:hypothetical protein
MCSLVGVAPAAGQARPATIPAWTKQAPAVHPLGRSGAAMAYDAATGTGVLFGGIGGRLKILRFADTWTWNGTTWAKQAPAVHPPALTGAAMAYDVATGTVVLFGGNNNKLGDLGQTWTWDGTTWTKQTPAASPSPRTGAGMAYDAATGTVVLFGGFADKTGLYLNDTWTWNGTTWTKQAPAASPPAWAAAGTAYDAATRTVVLFGGPNGDTWTWNGTTWTEQAPAASPSPRAGAGMAYDAATATVVLFGGIGYSTGHYLGDTWTWDGTTWTRQSPAASPATGDYPAMAYDAANSSVVLFGGYNGRGPYAYHSGTWIWG